VDLVPPSAHHLAQVLLNGRGQTAVEFGDGVLTERGTFQKYFEHLP
jgi:hypothetical protein